MSKFGGPENLHLIEEEIPEPSSSQVRVKVLTAGVSLADILIREGIHPESLFKRPPLSIGWDIVGTVDKMGNKASRTSTWRTGDMMAALPILGRKVIHYSIQTMKRRKPYWFLEICNVTVQNTDV